MTDAAWKPFTPPGPFPKWPSWRYGPNGQAEMFDKPDDVPPGWEDSPSKVLTVHLVATTEAPLPPSTQAPLPPPTESFTRKPITLRRKTPK